MLLEPTTGLDAFSAYNLIQTLRELARSGRTVVLSIHQPRADIFHLFGQVILLSKGNVVYAGPQASIYDYFANQGYACPLNVNIADFIIDISTIDIREESLEFESRNRVEKLLMYWKQHEKSFTSTPEGM